jgi:ankyrin repeat protein
MEQANKNLTNCASNGDLEGVKKALSEGANVNYFFNNAMIQACLGGHPEIVNYLIKKGASIYPEDRGPLYHAACCGNLEVVKVLLKADTNKEHRLGDAFWYACMNGHPEVVREFLKVLSEYKLFSLSGNLSWAKENRHTEIVELLEKYIENPNMFRKLVPIEEPEGKKKFEKTYKSILF